MLLTKPPEPHRSRVKRCRETANIYLELLGFWSMPVVQCYKKLEKLDLFPFSGEAETPILLGPLERANLVGTL
jgi:hypothetical protein